MPANTTHDFDINLDIDRDPSSTVVSHDLMIHDELASTTGKKWKPSSKPRLDEKSLKKPKDQEQV